MKILFIQLPLIDHGYNYIGGNVPYASAALTAFINNNFPDHKAEYLPYNAANFFSDKNILKYIINSDYDTVSFCCYLWNIERNLKIAEKLKLLKPDIKIIFGGPEICSDSFAMTEHRSYVDIFFSGEGEWFYRKIFSGSLMNGEILLNGNNYISQPPDNELSSEELCEPYIHNYLNDMPDGSVFIELTRGCPFRCSYCFYSKNSQKIREIDFSSIINTIKNKQSVKEIYILSPTFNGNRHFMDRLDQLVALKHNVRLHTELKAEGIDLKTARKIYSAGFKSLEIGIQTLNRAALKKAGRRADTDSEIIGLQNLLKAGIDLKVGIIPGMPEDTPDDFKNTIDILIENGVGDSLEFYPLMILPGTKIREQIAEYDIKFQDKPPYFIISSKDFTMDQILGLKEYMEDKTGLYASVSRNPDLIQSSESSLCKGIRLQGEEFISLTNDYLDEIVDTNVFSIICNTAVTIEFSVMKNIFTILKSRDELFNLIFEGDFLLQDDEIYELLKFSCKDNLFRRIHLYDEWKSGNSIMIYHYIENYDLFKKADTAYYYTEPVLKVTEVNSLSFKKDIRTFEEPPSVFITPAAYDDLSGVLVKYYSDYQDKISFEEKDNYRNFIERINCEYTDFPFEFRIIGF
ncbi:MAG: radical SAM protein [Spirochaetes bacterium]|nr:radical SAM protein [Spirochaetota bacterium]